MKVVPAIDLKGGQCVRLYQGDFEQALQQLARIGDSAEYSDDFWRKLAEAARENGISGLFAITSPQNQRMIKLFKTLPYKVVSVLGDDLLLNCRFDDPA